MKRFIPVAAPAIIGKEKEYVLDCLESTWISSGGKYLDRFEASFASFCNVKHAIACCNGTAALHLALLALGVGPGDEVIVPSLTFVSTANTVHYCGAKPVFVDSEPETWNMNPDLVEEKITPRTKAIIAVHLYGHPVDMDQIIQIASKYGIFLVEDAAEAHGAEYKGRRIGSLGNIATFSFYGNKIITTGEGGMVVTNDDSLAQKVNQFKGQGMDSNRRYWFPMVGYNYRMTNVAAAIGLAQLERVDWHIARRREIAARYFQCLESFAGITLQPEKPWARSVYWMNSVVLDEHLSLSRDRVMEALFEVGIETRPFFYPMHTLPMYEKFAEGQNFPVADRLAAQGFNLPSSAALSEEDLNFVCEQITTIIKTGIT